jgi:hypothetical protein
MPLITSACGLDRFQALSNMRLLLLFLIVSMPCFGQNVLVKFYRDEPNTNLWEKINNIPPLCISAFQSTPLPTIPLGWSTNWTITRFNEHQTTNTIVYNNWYANVRAAEAGVLATNIATLRNLYTSNALFMGMVATNRNAVVFTNNNLNVSNQIVTLSRILNQLGPLLKDLYKGD